MTPATLEGAAWRALTVTATIGVGVALAQLVRPVSSYSRVRLKAGEVIEFAHSHRPDRVAVRMVVTRITSDQDGVSMELTDAASYLEKRSGL